ncbi:MAG: hypothetical protein JW793_15685 [Acidobacteria bacterium]|nr:hypothetical protein [Acidobacteriota bacterium]
MQSKNKRIFPFEKTANGLRTMPPAGIPSRLGRRVLCLAAVFLGLLPAAAGLLPAVGDTDSPAVSGIDSRWLPWIGSWRLVPEAAETANEKQSGDYVLKISPGGDRNTVSMKAFRGEAALFEDAVVTDGLSRPFKEKECSGWYQYSWSETGKRLFFESKSGCPDESSQKISGLWIINQSGEWLDIQLLERQDDRIITLRRYSKVPDDGEYAGEFETGRIRAARISAASGLSIGEVVEMSRKLEPEVLEAALVEYYEPFQLDSKILVYLSDSGVPPQVVDLVVALSYPEKFTVERRTVSIVPVSDSPGPNSGVSYAYPPYGHYYIFDPLFPWYWSPYTYSLYWNSGWGGWPGYYYPYWSGSGHPGNDYHGSGRLVAGRGYTQIHSRSSSTAKPRGGGGASSPALGSSRSVPKSNARTYTQGSGISTSSPAPSGSGSTASPSPSYVTGSSAPYGGGGYVSPSSGGGAPSATPGGYSGGSGGRKAKER